MLQVYTCLQTVVHSYCTSGWSKEGRYWRMQHVEVSLDLPDIRAVGPKTATIVAQEVLKHILYFRQQIPLYLSCSDLSDVLSQSFP